MLIGLETKNAILIIEFAVEHAPRSDGLSHRRVGQGRPRASGSDRS